MNSHIHFVSDEEEVKNLKKDSNSFKNPELSKRKVRNEALEII